MKTILLSLIAALSLSAATFTVITKNDAGVTTNTTVITVDLQSWNKWRLAQIAQAEVPARAESRGPDTIGPNGEVIPGEIIPAFPGIPAVLKYPTPDSLLKAVFDQFFRANNIAFTYNAAILAERKKIDAANAEIERLRALAVVIP